MTANPYTLGVTCCGSSIRIISTRAQRIEDVVVADGTRHGCVERGHERPLGN